MAPLWCSLHSILTLMFLDALVCSRLAPLVPVIPHPYISILPPSFILWQDAREAKQAELFTMADLTQCCYCIYLAPFVWVPSAGNDCTVWIDYLPLHHFVQVDRRSVLIMHVLSNTFTSDIFLFQSTPWQLAKHSVWQGKQRDFHCCFEQKNCSKYSK